MSDRAWDDLITLLDDKYHLDENKRFKEPLEDKPDLERTIERIEFTKDNESFRIDRVTSPTIVDRKTFYHHRGSADRVEYTYDPEETSNKVLFYKQSAGGYEEISPESMLG